MSIGFPPHPARSPCVLWCCLLACVVTSSAAESSPATYRAPGTERMANRLQKIAAESDPIKNIYLNADRAVLFGKQLNQLLAQPDTPDKGAKVLDLDSKYATELLLAGRSWD